jgi:hypothetical protein
MEANTLTPTISIGNAIRITEAAQLIGCTVEDLLIQASRDEHLLYVALGPYSAKLIATPSHENPREGSYTRNYHSLVALAGQYAGEIYIAGHADISYYQADFSGGVLDWHIWLLDEPQTVDVSKLFVRRLDVPGEDARSGSDRPVPDNPVETEQGQGERRSPRDVQIRLICDIAKGFGYDLLDIPYGGKAKIEAECIKNAWLTKDQFRTAWNEANRRKVIRVHNKEVYMGKS